MGSVYFGPPTDRQPIVGWEGSWFWGSCPIWKSHHWRRFPLRPQRGRVGPGRGQGGVVGDEGAVGHHLVAWEGVVAVGEVSGQGSVMPLVALVSLVTLVALMALVREVRATWGEPVGRV